MSEGGKDGGLRVDPTTLKKPLESNSQKYVKEVDPQNGFTTRMVFSSSRLDTMKRVAGDLGIRITPIAQEGEEYDHIVTEKETEPTTSGDTTTKPDTLHGTVPEGYTYIEISRKNKPHLSDLWDAVRAEEEKAKDQNP